MRVVIIGMQGSGKGTIAGMIKKKLGIPAVTSGEIFRRMKDTEIGRKINEYINKGNLAPDELTNKVIKEELKKERYKKGYVLDGYPRRLEQAKAFGLENVDKVILLKISEETSVKRIMGRMQCRKCGKIYHKDLMLPKKEGICDICNGKLYVREDDKDMGAIRKRIEIYHKETEPMLKFYKDILEEADGEQPVEKVFEDVKAILQK